MKDVSEKPDSLRTAVAVAELRAGPQTLAAVRSGSVPKGNVLETARVAGIQAAKKTWEWLPFCHSLPLDHADIESVLEEDRLRFKATVRAVWKTGVEMEALTAASAAALTAYDMLKPLDKELVIEQVKLLEKRGGKSSLKLRLPDRPLRGAVLVTSDGTAAGTRQDRSGRIIRDRLAELGVQVMAYEVVPDERVAIEGAVRDWVANDVDLVLTTGGTGLGPRDVTVDTIAAMLERPVAGVAEAMRAHGQRRTPFAMLSRGVAGVIGRTLVVTLPGSSRGAAESMDAVFPGLLHAIPMLEGANHG